ncbi:MAG: sucrose-6-phosphate hydrolase [Eubacteriales bacterium]|nr:sucrose-6-phosphate hydrolase [Eubacteriales bacterium]
MISEKLKKARDFEETEMKKITESERPAFHVTGGLGWINDPNGFSCYKGEYHLFHQYHPYSNLWGPMHWGHLKSKDMITWERLPIVMAPDETYDDFGCFSGSALELEDGRHLLMYTGVQTIENGEQDCRQTQCLAFGDGVHYEKYEHNPVILPETLPEGSSTRDFRDPKIWQEDGIFYSVTVGMDEEENGFVALYKSTDLIHWEFCTVLDRSSKKLGGMWECPDFFEVDGKHVLLVSPMAMMPDEDEFHAGHGTLAIVGHYDKESQTFTRESLQSVDGGIDFYAPTTMVTPDGRRIVIAWMQGWPNSKFVPPHVKYFGQLTVPCELNIRDGRLVRNPIRELLDYRRNPVFHKDVLISDQKVELEKVSGRVLDMTVRIRDFENLEKLTIRTAENEEYHTSVSYDPKHGILNFDRTFSGYLYDILHTRDLHVQPQNGELKLRFILDRYSLEVFVNDGERVGTVLLFTPLEAQNISFEAKGSAVIDVEKYELNV